MYDRLVWCSGLLPPMLNHADGLCFMSALFHVRLARLCHRNVSQGIFSCR